jgi:2-(1,2-epoxy-1,2-dihydrophenyl)acetyl-CoA isomerase
MVEIRNAVTGRLISGFSAGVVGALALSKTTVATLERRERPAAARGRFRWRSLPRVSEALVNREGPVLTITLNRPDVYNALNSALRSALGAALEEAVDPAVRTVVLTGAGKAFCAGQEVSELQELSAPLGEWLEAQYHPLVRSLRSLEKPVVAAVNGAAAGAGLALALACDVRTASEAAVFVPGWIGLGLVPDAGGSWFAERALGQARAFEWMTSNRRLLAEEALAWGLVSEVLPADGFAAAVAERAAEWAARPTRAVAVTKRLLTEAHTRTLEEQLALEAAAQEELVASEDHQEGMAAFLEKRPAAFRGA